MRVASFFGLATGMGEVAIRLVPAFFGRPLRLPAGPEMIWMIPLAGALLFAAAGVLIVLVGLFWHGKGFDRVTLASLVALGAYTLLLHRPSLLLAARILLSLGIGVEASRRLALKREALHRFARLAVWPALFVVFLTAIAFRVTDAVTERRAVAALPAPAADAPNVLLIVLDVVRAADLSLYGYARATTPNLQRFASSGVVFERAVATAPWTLPSHATLFTGHYPHELTADWDVPLDDTYKTLAELLRERGYATGGFVANLQYGPPAFGLSRGFLHYESGHHTAGEVIASSRLGEELEARINKLTHSYHVAGRMDAAEVNRRLFDWLPPKGSRPFFVFLNYFDAHAPYVAPSPYGNRFSGAEPPTRNIRHGRRNSAVELRGMRDAYDGSIAYIDEQLAALFRELERRGLLSNTLVIITSDHGEEFGEHEWVGHGNGLYFPSLHVPLMISFPGSVPGGVRVPEWVTLRDVSATVADLLGIDSTAGIPGQSLAFRWGAPVNGSVREASPVLSEVNRPRRIARWYAVAKGPMRSIISGKYHYIRNGDGREEIYDVRADPWERIDLAQSGDSAALLRVARSQLDSALHIGVPVAAPGK